MNKLLPLVLTSTIALWTALAHADDDTFTLTIKDHQFSPSTVEVPTGKKIKLVVKNLDATPEEFESDSLRREKVIPGGKEAVISIGPLKPGSYSFKGEFHAKTAQGTVVAK
jgi:plastocyanin